MALRLCCCVLSCFVISDENDVGLHVSVYPCMYIQDVAIFEATEAAAKVEIGKPLNCIMPQQGKNEDHACMSKI